jgi:hypothetical protein
MQFDRTENAYYFFPLVFSSIIIALFGGSIIDTTVRKLQNDDNDFKTRSKFKAFWFFMLQSFINVLVMLILVRSFTSFTTWLQLSISGAFFAVVFFVSQRNYTDNVNALTNIT